MLILIWDWEREREIERYRLDRYLLISRIVF